MTPSNVDKNAIVVFECAHLSQNMQIFRANSFEMLIPWSRFSVIEMEKSISMAGSSMFGLFKAADTLYSQSRQKHYMCQSSCSK